MSGNTTFTMIKPNAVNNGHTGAIIEKITKEGFKIKAMKMVKLTREKAEQFYEIHKDRPFFEGLCVFMSSGPVVALILEKEDAVKKYRAFIGATNPEDAHEGSIRKLYGTNVQQNAVHGSDSDENAKIESKFFFSELEIY